MPFIGNKPADSFTSFAKQDFTTSATTSYTLDYPVANANEIALFINFVRQEPTTAYTASGTSLTLTSATSASDDMYCVFLGKALQTVNPPAGSVGTSQLVDGAVTSAKLASGAIANTPAFIATASADQSISNNTVVKVTFDTEELDTDNAFASNKFTVPTGKAGKYLIHSAVRLETSTDTNLEILIYKNGSEIIRRRNFNGSFDFSQVTQILDLADADYLEIYVKHEAGSATNISGGTTDPVRSMFQGYKLIGV
jgi:hypothetical protein